MFLDKVKQLIEKKKDRSFCEDCYSNMKYYGLIYPDERCCGAISNIGYLKPYCKICPYLVKENDND